MFGNVLTKKIEELLLAWMHPVLEHSSFSVVARIRFLEQTLGFVIAYQLRTAVRGFKDNMSRETTQHTSNWLFEHLPHHRTIGADDGTNCDSCKGKASYSNHQTLFSKLYTSCYITLIQLRVRMFPLMYLKSRRSSMSCSKILAETS